MCYYKIRSDTTHEILASPAKMNGQKTTPNEGKNGLLHTQYVANNFVFGQDGWGPGPLQFYSVKIIVCNILGV